MEISSTFSGLLRIDKNNYQLKFNAIIIRFIFTVSTLFILEIAFYLVLFWISRFKISATNFWSKGSSVRYLCSVFGAQILEILETRSKQLWAPSYVLRLYQPVQSRINLIQSIKEKTTKQPINSCFFKKRWWRQCTSNTFQNYFSMWKSWAKTAIALLHYPI